MTDERETRNPEDIVTDEEGMLSRRIFLDGLGKWSKIVIGAVVLGSSVIAADREAKAGVAGWVNRGGGSAAGWANRGGGAWANRGAAWANRGGAWVNRF